MKKECRRCQGFLKYEEDQWGGHQLCVTCGWENLVYRVSEDREDAIMRHQLHTEQREGLAVRSGSLTNQRLPVELIRRIHGGTEEDHIADLALGLARD